MKESNRRQMNQLRLFFTQIQVANITPTMMHIIHTFLDRFLSNSYVLTLFNKSHITLLAWAGISSSYHRKYPHPPRAYKIKEKNWIINKVILYYIGQKKWICFTFEVLQQRDLRPGLDCVHEVFISTTFPHWHSTFSVEEDKFDIGTWWLRRNQWKRDII